MKNGNLLVKTFRIIIVFMFGIHFAFAQDSLTVYQKKIIEYTTDDRFLPQSVLDILDRKSVV